MFLTEYDEEKHIRQEREEAWEDGQKAGWKNGQEEAFEIVASDMLREGDSVAKVSRISRLPEETVRNLAKALGISVI